MYPPRRHGEKPPRCPDSPVNPLPPSGRPVGSRKQVPAGGRDLQSCVRQSAERPLSAISYSRRQEPPPPATPARARRRFGTLRGTKNAVPSNWLNLYINIYIIQHMKQILVELDDDVSAKLERIAPGRSRRRSEFIRMAIRRALWDLEEQATTEAYRKHPDSAADTYIDAKVWEPRPARGRTRR